MLVWQSPSPGISCLCFEIPLVCALGGFKLTSPLGFCTEPRCSGSLSHLPAEEKSKLSLVHWLIQYLLFHFLPVGIFFVSERQLQTTVFL